MAKLGGQSLTDLAAAVPDFNLQLPYLLTSGVNYEETSIFETYSHLFKAVLVNCQYFMHMPNMWET